MEIILFCSETITFFMVFMFIPHSEMIQLAFKWTEEKDLREI